MRRLVLAFCVAVAGAALAAGAAQSAPKGAVLCVGKAPHCYPTIQAAVERGERRRHDSARLRDVRRRDHDHEEHQPRRLRGRATVISGGGPVLTIGTLGAATEPTVAISGVKITGGVTSQRRARDQFTGAAFTARRRRHLRPAGRQLRAGRDGDRQQQRRQRQPRRSHERSARLPDQVSFWPACPTGPCPYAGASGGGIDNWGALTLTNTIVT